MKTPTVEAFFAEHAAHGEPVLTKLPTRPVPFLKFTCKRCDKHVVIPDDGKEEIRMARGKKKDGGAAQPPLIPLSAAELADAVKRLPIAIGELEEMEDEHAKVAKEHRRERKKLKAEIDNIARQIREQGR